MKIINETKPLEILVVEDNAEHIRHAKETLAEYGTVNVVETYKDAINYLKEKTPDVVLTDERIPFAKSAVYPVESTFTGQPIPIGSKVVLYAIAKNVPYVALITDVNHHSDEIAGTQDDFSNLCKNVGEYYGVKIGNTNYLECSQLCMGDGIKRYDRALKTFQKEKGGCRYDPA